MTATPGPLGFFSSTPSPQAGVLLAELIAAAGSEVVVLPTGAAYEGPQEAITRIVELLQPFGAVVTPVMVLSRTDAERGDFAEIIRAARCICIVGGSPLHLRSVLKDSTVLAALVAAWHEGGVVIGFDSGAVVLSDPMVDPRGGAFTVGLGLVRDLAVVVDFSGAISGSLERTLSLAAQEIAVVAIGVDGGLVRDQGGVWLAEGRVTVFSDSVAVGMSELAGKPVG
jgi:cyanophycinase